MTFGDAAAEWVREYGGLWQETTRAAYSIILRVHLQTDLGPLDVAVLTPGLLVQFIGTKLAAGCAPRYVRQMLNVIRQVLDVAVEHGALAANPADRAWKRAKLRLAVRTHPAAGAIEPAPGLQLVEGVRELHADIARVVEVYRSAGVRTAEALGLWESDLDFAHHRMTVQRQWRGVAKGWRATKTRDVRVIDMSGRLELVLRAALERSRQIAADLASAAEPRWVFRSARTGVPWHQRTVSGLLCDVGRQLAFARYSAKGFRHGLASHLMNRGENPKAVQELLGHTSLTTTLGYSRHGRAQRRLGPDGGGGF